MSLDKQVVGVSFTRGLDTQTDRRIVVPGSMVALQNLTMAEADTFQRRPGNGAMVAGTALSTLGSLGDQLTVLDGSTLKTYDQQGNALRSAGSVDNVTLETEEIVRGVGANDSYDCATSGGYVCYVWRHFTSGTVTSAATITVIEEATGAHVLRETGMRTSAAMRCPRVVAVTGAFIIFYFDRGTGTLYSRVVDLTAPGTLGGETSLRTDLSTNCHTIDACSSGANAFVYYASSDATNSSRAITVTRSGTTPSVAAGPVNVTTQAQIADSDIAGLAAATFTASLIGVYLVTDTTAGTPGLWGAVVTAAMAISAAAAQKDATAAALSRANVTAVLNSTTMSVYSDDPGRAGEATATARLVRRTGLDSANTITSAATTWVNSMTRPNGINGPYIVGKAFVVGGSVYVPMSMIEAGTGTLQNSWYLMVDTGTGFRVVAHALYGTWGPPVSPEVGIPSALMFSATDVGVVTGRRTFLSFADGINVSSTGMTRLNLTFNTTVPLMESTIGPVLSFGNATLSMYDGDLACESAFYLFPEVVTAASGGAGSVPAGTRSIVALYEWVDAAGQRHQSAPSVAISYTDAGATIVNVVVPTLTLSQKTAFDVVVYATVVGATGTVFHRVSSLVSPTANSTTASTVTVVYNITDTALAAGEVLYTTGGVLPNNSPPPCATLEPHQERYFINVSDDPYAFQFSQPWVSGFGVQWNETLRGRVESTGGPLTAFASLDDKLIIFRPRRIGVLFGQGPGTTGLGGSYQLQDLPTDVGCSEPRSVLVMPEGVIFKSTSKGWYRLGRDLSLRWIGEGVQEWDDQGVTSAVLLDTLKECRFTTNDASGLTLVYFYGQKGADGVGQWGTYSNFTGVDAVWWPGGDTYVRATSTAIYKELPATSDGYAYGDGATTALGAIGNSPVPFTGSPIVTVFQTGWLKPGEAISAFQRVWRVLLAGAVAGYRPTGSTTLTQDEAIGNVSLHVASTTGFEGSSAIISLGASTYEVVSYSVVSATLLDLGAPLANNHLTGATVWTQERSLGATGTLAVAFYYNGDDSAAVHTITTSDVGDLVSGTAWAIRMVPHLQKSDSLMIKVTNTPAVSDPGASLNFSGMTLELGVKKGARRLPAAQTK